MSGTIDAPIGRHPNHDYKWAVTAEGKPSVTHYDLIEAFRAASLLDIKLETGRTHQIRVHMAAHRHPCVGDLTYGADPTLAKRLRLTRQWLHAVRLGFEHPGGRAVGGVRERLPGRPAAGPGPGPRGEPRVIPTSYALRVADAPADREACFAVRKEVFVGEQGVPEDIEYDVYDADAVHVLAVRGDGVPLGTGRLLHGEAAAAKTDGRPVRGVAGAARGDEGRARARGRGGARRGHRGRGPRARTRGCGSARADTRAGFYERLGYLAYGPEFLDAGIPHRAMRRVL